MSVACDTLDDAGDQPGWDAYVRAHPDASGYHLWRWRRVFETAFGHETTYLAARESSAIAGVLPLVTFDSWAFGRFAISLPFVNYGGVLADNEPVARALVDAAGRLAAERSWRFVELRHRRRTEPALAVKQHKVAMLLPLERDEDAMWVALDRKVRNQIRKAMKSGLVVEQGGSELLRDFYDVFASNMRELGTPVYDAGFFEAVLVQLGAAARVFVARAGRRAVAAAIACAFRDVIEVPWAASLRSCRALEPNDLVYWTVIQHAIANGMRTLDFGRSTPGDGPFHYKKHWGAVPQPLAWEYWLAEGEPLPDLSPKNPRFRLAISAWKHLPVPITRWLGPALVRNIP